MLAPLSVKPWLRLRILLALATRHPQNCSAAEVEGDSSCNHGSTMSATCYKSSIRWIFYNIVPAILLQNLPLANVQTSWLHNPCNIRKKCLVACVSKNVPHVATALSNELHSFKQTSALISQGMCIYFLLVIHGPTKPAFVSSDLCLVCRLH